MAYRLPTAMVLVSVVLLLYGLEAFLFALTVMVPSLAFAQKVGDRLVEFGLAGNVAAGIVAGAWILGVALYMLMQHRLPSGFRVPRTVPTTIAVAIFAAVTLILAFTDLASLMDAFRMLAMSIFYPFIKPFVETNTGIASAVSVGLLVLYSLFSSWFARALDRTRASILLAASMASIVALVVSLISLVIVVKMFEVIQEHVASNTLIVAALVVLGLVALRDIRDALLRMDPTLLAQLPAFYVLANLATPLVGNEILSVLLLATYWLVVVGILLGLATNSRRMLVAAAIVSSAMSLVA